MSIIADFVYDLARLQDKSTMPLNDKAIMSIMDEWRGFNKGEVYYRHIENSEHQRRVKTFDTSSCDREAAEKLGITYAVFHRWRKWYGLKPKGKTGPRRINQ